MMKKFLSVRWKVDETALRERDHFFACVERDYFVVNLWTVVLLNVSPGLRMVDGKLG